MNSSAATPASSNRRDQAVLGVHRDDDSARIRLRHVADELRLLERRRADHDPRDAKVEPARDAFGRADPATQLHMSRKPRDDGFHGVAIDALTGKGAVEIDDVEMVRARIREQHRLRRGIVAINGRAVHIALRQTHDLAAFQIDRGKDDKTHGRHSRKRSSSARP